jgi:hypothetical protein
MYRETRDEPDDYATATREKSHLLVPEILEPPVIMYVLASAHFVALQLSQNPKWHSC